MTDDDKTQFADSISALQIAFGQQAGTDVTAAYWQFLKDIPLADFRRAVGSAGRTLRWFPKPSELRDLAGARTIEATAAEAWGAVRAAIDKHDYTDSVDFGPLVNAVIRNLGGWQGLCAARLTDLDVWRRKEFLRVYEAFSSLDPQTLSGHPHRGELDGQMVRIAIGGHLPPAQLEPPLSSPSGQIQQLVTELAKTKS